MLSSLLDLAKQPDSDKRRELLGAVSDLFYADGRDVIAEREMQLYADVVTRVLKDMAVRDRSDYAQLVAADKRTPRDVALALAHDVATVATPVLEQSKALTEDDLIAVARKADTDHRVAISRRTDVGMRVTDALLDFGETEVMETLLENSTSKLSEKSFERILERSTTTAQLADKMSFRDDVPSAVLRRLLPLLGPEAHAHALALLEAGDSRLEEMAQASMSAVAKQRLDSAKRRLEIKHLARNVEARELGIDDFAENLVSHHNPLDLALGLAEISMLPEKQVANAVLSTEAEPLALICKALDLGPLTYEMAERLRRRSMKLPKEIPPAVLDSYDTLSTEQAQRTLRFVNLRTSLAKAG